MTIRIEKPGLQSTIQSNPFVGHRHIGMPASGAADCLSHCLANRLVGKGPDTAALEITLDDMIFTCLAPCTIAVTGAASFVRVNEETFPLHQTLPLEPDDRVQIGPAQAACRTYVAVSGEWEAPSILGSQSTCLQAGLGGFSGRALAHGDELIFSSRNSPPEPAHTPDQLRPNFSNSHLLRVTAGPEIANLTADSREFLGAETWQVGTRSSRMGIQLTGPAVALTNNRTMPSAAVFPGTIQCPPDGKPFLLGPDAQTTGGYARIAQVIRADRHLIGQLRANDRVQLVLINAEKAREIYLQKRKLLQPWLGDIDLW